MTQQFIEFVMMQAQNAAHFLGQIPNPQTGKGEVNLELAKMFIDQLIMIRVKTRNNLSQDEAAVLNNAISNLQIVFVEVSQGAPIGDEEVAEQVTGSAEPPAEPAKTEEPPAEQESRKKFTKSYGA